MELQVAERLAYDLMREHNLLPQWAFAFDYAKSRAGRTTYSPRAITLSRYIVALNDEAMVRNTILHEIGHALAGAHAGHGPEWQRVTRSIGGSVEKYLSVDKVVMPEAPWTLRCIACGYTSMHYRKTRARRACKRCCDQHNGGRFSLDYLMEWYRTSDIRESVSH